MNSRRFQRRRMTEAEIYGYIYNVDESEARRAYEVFCENEGKDRANDAIVNALTTHELARVLTYLFRKHDFKAFGIEEDIDDEYEESCGTHRRMRTERLSARHMPRRLRRR